MTSPTLTLIMATILFALFPPTRILSAGGLLLLIYLHPVAVGIVLGTGVACMGYYAWKHN
jgi:hypothetical protein